MPLGYFTDSTPLTPLRDPFNVLVDGINNVETAVGDLENSRALQTFRWADATERAAQTGMQAGDVGYQMDTKMAYEYNGAAWVYVKSGQIPTSVSVGSGSSSVAADGLVSFTGASTVSLNGVFDDPTANYEVIVVATHSASGTVNCRLRAAGVDTAANYSYIINVTQLSAGPTRISSTTGTGFGFLRSSGSGTSGDVRGRYTIFTPKATSASVILEGASAAVYGGDRWHIGEMGQVGSGVSGFDGFSVIASAGTLTGTIKVRKV